MDLCYKADHLQENIGIVHLKNCPAGQMCHGKLNRCMSDPYNLFEGKLAGQTCQYNYQCASGQCVSKIEDARNVNDQYIDDFSNSFVCSGLRIGDSCNLDNECGIG
jgi:hypothetical protein